LDLHKATGREVRGTEPSQGVATKTNAAGRGSGPHCPQAAGPRLGPRRYSVTRVRERGHSLQEIREASNSGRLDGDYKAFKDSTELFLARPAEG
jgi:hypothetical protein